MGGGCCQATGPSYLDFQAWMPYILFSLSVMVPSPRPSSQPWQLQLSLHSEQACRFHRKNMQNWPNKIIALLRITVAGSKILD